MPFLFSNFHCRIPALLTTGKAETLLAFKGEQRRIKSLGILSFSPHLSFKPLHTSPLLLSPLPSFPCGHIHGIPGILRLNARLGWPLAQDTGATSAVDTVIVCWQQLLSLMLFFACIEITELF